MKVIKLRDELRKGAVPVRSPDHQRGNQRGKSKLTFGKLVPKKKTITPRLVWKLY